MKELKNAPGSKLKVITGKIAGYDFEKPEIYEDDQEKWLVKGKNCEIAESGYKMTIKKRPFYWRHNSSVKTNFLADGTFDLDGNPQLLTNGSFTFQNLLIDENSLRIEITRPGTLEVQGDQVTIRLD